MIVSFFAKFIKETKDKTAEERAQALELNSDIEVEHQQVASEAKSDVNHEVNANLHFNCFVHVDGSLYELDGRKKFPIHHGKTTQKSLLKDAVNVIKQFMARDPKEIRWNMAVLIGPDAVSGGASDGAGSGSGSGSASGGSGSAATATEWACGACTVIQVNSASVCSVCGTPKGF